MGKCEIFPFVKTMRILPCQPRSDFQLDDVALFRDRLDGIRKLFANAETSRAFIDIEFLDFPDLSRMVHQVLDVAAQQTNGLLTIKSQQVNDVRMQQIFSIQTLLYRFVKHFVFKQVDKIVYRFKIGRGRKSDGDGFQIRAVLVSVKINKITAK